MRLSFLLTPLLSIALVVSAAAQSKKSPASPAAPSESDVRNAPRALPARSDTPVAPSSNQTGAVFRPGDSLDMRVSGIPQEASSEFPTPITIGSDGTINVTHVGLIRAAGLTQSQLEQAIQKRFRDEKIFRNPTVTVNSTVQQRYVTVGGNVRAPNRYGWSADLTLTTALASASGLSDFASGKINLIRAGTITLYKYKDIKRNPADDPKLMPGDQLDAL